VFLDLETTGLDIEKDRIVQIGMKKLMTNGLQQFYGKLVNPTIPIPSEATSIHGITDDDVKRAPTFSEIAGEVIEFMGAVRFDNSVLLVDCDFSGYNILGFDAPLLNAELARVGIKWDYSEINFIDSMRIAKKMEPRNLDWASKFYCDVELSGAHDAESDSSAAADILVAQIERYENVPCTTEELALFCNDGNKLLDLSGIFRYNKAGEIVFNFGKHKDEPAMSHADYLSWMLGRDFPADTKAIIRKMLL
jgi:DNA polymerase-3 subunit epsilon